MYKEKTNYITRPVNRRLFPETIVTTENPSLSSTESMESFHSNISTRFDEVQLSTLKFMDKVSLLEKKYNSLLKTTEHYYSENNEKRDSLIAEMAKVITDYNSVMLESHDKLKKINKEICKKLKDLETLGEESLDCKFLLDMQTNCSILLSNMIAKANLIDTLYRELREAKEKTYQTESTKNPSATQSMRFFHKSIYTRFQTDGQLISTFLEDVSLLEKKYKTLLKSLGYNYGKYLHALHTSTDYNMEKFYKELGNLLDDIDMTLGNQSQTYKQSLIDSCRSLKNCGLDLDKKLADLPKNSPYYKPLLEMRENCIILLKNFMSSFKLLNTVYNELRAVKEILGGERMENTTDNAALKNYIIQKLVSKCHQTPAQASAFLSQTKTNTLIGSLRHTDHALQIDIANKFVNGIRKAQVPPQEIRYQNASSKLRSIR